MSNSNIEQVTRWLEGWLDSFDFTRPGREQSLGRDVANKVVERIAERAVNDRKGAESEWDANTEEVAKQKAAHYGVGDHAPNERTGQMTSPTSLYGRTSIEAKQITMVYGTGQPPTRCATGAELKESDKQRTDVEKAYYAHTGQSVHKIKRPFYEVNQDDAVAVVGLCQENLNGYIREEIAKRGY